MALTGEQQTAVDTPGNVCLISCPGSGKTRSIVAKLVRCIEDVRESTRRVACITHTNAAADEIYSRLRMTCFSGEESYYEVTTIHAFALHAILRPFHRRLPEFKSGFQILTADDEPYLAKRREIMNAFAMEPFRSGDFENLQRGPNGEALAPDGFPPAAASEWFEWLDSCSCTSLSDIVYHSCRLLQEHEFIASSLASKYGWILVDEFQDSSPSQLFILRQIHQYRRTSFFCVGDPNQSIYGFAGASPALMTEFAAHIEATKKPLSGNFRCSNLITSVAQRLLPIDPPMSAIGPNRDCDVEPQHYCVASPLAGVLGTFIPAAIALGVKYGQMAVLAPWWDKLFPVARELRAAGIPVIGPGARPYKRDNPFSLLAEAAGAYLESREPDIAHAVQRALFITLSNLTGESPWSVFRYSGRVVVCRLLAEAVAARENNEVATEWLLEAADRFRNVLVGADYLPAVYEEVFTAGATTMAAEIERFIRHGQPLKIEDLGMFARPKHCVHLMTVHKAKGREFQAVAVIDAHDGRFPHFKTYEVEDVGKQRDMYEESRRLMYVATTRAERLLMYFTDTSHRRNTPSPFLRDLGVI